jgi:GTP-binding protein
MNRNIVHQRAASSPDRAEESARPFQQTQFLLSVGPSGQFPADSGAEIAIAGRSNAGKSSAINAITARRVLARTSKQPGRTRLLNFFELWPGARLVDLPGYGYAEGAREERTSWSVLIGVLARRQALRGMWLVVDVRRGLMESDEQLLEWSRQHRWQVHVLLSKADQLSRSAAAAMLSRARAQLQATATVQLLSVRDQTGVVEARERLLQALRAPEVSQGDPGSGP